MPGWGNVRPPGFTNPATGQWQEHGHGARRKKSLPGGGSAETNHLLPGEMRIGGKTYRPGPPAIPGGFETDPELLQVNWEHGQAARKAAGLPARAGAMQAQPPRHTDRRTPRYDVLSGTTGPAIAVSASVRRASAKTNTSHTLAGAAAGESGVPTPPPRSDPSGRHGVEPRMRMAPLVIGPLGLVFLYAVHSNAVTSATFVFAAAVLLIAQWVYVSSGAVRRAGTWLHATGVILLVATTAAMNHVLARLRYLDHSEQVYHVAPTYEGIAVCTGIALTVLPPVVTVLVVVGPRRLGRLRSRAQRSS